MRLFWRRQLTFWLWIALAFCGGTRLASACCQVKKPEPVSCCASASVPSCQCGLRLADQPGAPSRHCFCHPPDIPREPAPQSERIQASDYVVTTLPALMLWLHVAFEPCCPAGTTLPISTLDRLPAPPRAPPFQG